MYKMDVLESYLLKVIQKEVIAVDLSVIYDEYLQFYCNLLYFSD